MRTARSVQFALPFTLSLALHVGAIAAMFITKGSEHGVQSQPYRVRLIPAPKGIPDMGEVTKTPPKEAPTPPVQKTAVQRSKTPDVSKVATTKNTSTKTPPKQTVTSDPVKALKANTADPTNRSNTKAPTPTVAGSSTGGTGTNTADAMFNGIDFPDDRYLRNIVDRIAKFFQPQGTYALVAEFTFDINRSGCMNNVKLVKGSAISDFNLEARVAIEQAGKDCAFNPLPAVWTDDILSVRFRFDPKLLRK